MEYKANLLIEMITEWGRNFHLEFNANKTKFIRISKEAMYRQPIIKIGEKVLENSQELPCLGVIFDQSFIFDRHVEKVVTKAKKALFLIRRFSANT